MKSTILFTICWVIFAHTLAQKTIEKHINFSGKEKLILNIQIADSIKVHTWNKEEVYAKASVNVNDNEDNDAYVTDFAEAGKDVEITAKIRDGYIREKKHCCTETEITWVLFIPEKTVFSIETINGDIIIDGVTTEINAKTISGFIDLAMAGSRKADLEMKTISGTLYTDLDINTASSENSIPVVVKHKLNNGGDQVNLETISGDIFVRKSK
jgi:hypothetical protein